MRMLSLNTGVMFMTQKSWHYTSVTFRKLFKQRN